MTRVSDLIAIAQDALAEGRTAEARAVIAEVEAQAVPVAQVMPHPPLSAADFHLGNRHRADWGAPPIRVPDWALVQDERIELTRRLVRYDVVDDVARFAEIVAQMPAVEPPNIWVPSDLAEQLRRYYSELPNTPVECRCITLSPASESPPDQPDSFRPGSRKPGTRRNPPPVPKWARKRRAS